ncbi:hypothetical protein E4665_08320 [Sporolactobacillus shoreae]|uniref:Uncharacterized protein n=1 Tax=Sporolactobacillus shoreae TaxID=1465501 RepID=A0A4Z0GR01_9BACL|nr:hypothetical protein [Sporolactobacillus shoreae]TGA98513.1 hypothetical protein E4665_08320 [Sporolactobacillus shoreae]
MNNNDLFLLYLLLLIFALPFLNRKESISDYVTCRPKLGLNEGTLLLLSHLLKGFMILILFQFISGRNLFWGIIFNLILFPVILLFEKWIRSLMAVHLNTPNHTSLTFFRERSTLHAYHCLLAIMALVAFFAFTAEITWMSLITANIFHIPQQLVCVALVYLIYVYAVIGGFSAIAKASRLLIVFAFGTIACLLLYIYLTNGINTVYQNWMMKQQPLKFNFFSDIFDQGLWFFMMICVYYGYLLTNLSLWHVNFSLRVNRIRAIYRNAIFCFASLIITLMMIGIFAQSIDTSRTSSLNGIFYTLSRYSFFFTLLLTASLLCIGLISSMVSLKSIMDAFLLSLPDSGDHDRQFFKNVYLTALGLLLILSVILQPSYSILILSAKLFSLLCVVSIPCFSLIMISREKVSLIRLLPAGAGLAVGLYFFILSFPLLSGLFWGLITSLCLQTVLWLCHVSLQRR